MAAIYTRSGNNKEALEWLYKAFLANDPYMPSVFANLIFDCLHYEIEFMELIERMNDPV